MTQHKPQPLPPPYHLPDIVSCISLGTPEVHIHHCLQALFDVKFRDNILFAIIETRFAKWVGGSSPYTLYACSPRPSRHSRRHWLPNEPNDEWREIFPPMQNLLQGYIYPHRHIFIIIIFPRLLLQARSHRINIRKFLFEK